MAQAVKEKTPVEYLGFLEILALIFITLKLTGVIGWSWWWVLAPLWGQVVAFFLILGIAFLVIIAKESR